MQASLDYEQRLQRLFFPEGIAFDGNRFNRTAATAPLFNYLAPSECADEKVVSREGIEPSTHGLKVRCSTAELPALGGLEDPRDVHGRRTEVRSYDRTRNDRNERAADAN